MAAEFDQRPLDLKLVFLGDSAVGKTALLRRFNTGLPPKEGKPVDAYTFTDSIQVDRKVILLVVGRWGSGRKDTNVFGLFRTQARTFSCYVLT